MTDHIFPNGIRFCEPNEKAPEWVKGSLWVTSVKEFIQFLEANQKNDQLNMNIKVSQRTNKKYLELDTYVSKKKEDNPPYESYAAEKHALDDEIKVSDIPF